MISTRAGLAAFMSCITVAFFSFRYQPAHGVLLQNNSSFVSSEGHRGDGCLFAIEETIGKRSTLEPLFDVSMFPSTVLQQAI